MADAPKPPPTFIEHARAREVQQREAYRRQQMVADEATQTWWQRVQARDAEWPYSPTNDPDLLSLLPQDVRDRRELIRVVEAQHRALRAFVKWADRNDWGCVPKQVEHGMRAALALLDRPAQEVDRGE